MEAAELEKESEAPWLLESSSLAEEDMAFDEIGMLGLNGSLIAPTHG